MNENRDDIVPGPIQLQNYAATGERPKEGWTLRVDFFAEESPHSILKWKEAADELSATQIFNLKGPVQWGCPVVQAMVEALLRETPADLQDLIYTLEGPETYTGRISGEWCRMYMKGGEEYIKEVKSFSDLLDYLWNREEGEKKEEANDDGVPFNEYLMEFLSSTPRVSN